MNAALTEGTQAEMTNLEWGMLKDLGWNVVDPPGFYRNWDLFTQGRRWRRCTVRVIPSQGVYLMAVDALAGDTLELQTRDGTASSEKGVDTYLKLFDAQGRLLTPERQFRLLEQALS